MERSNLLKPIKDAIENGSVDELIDALDEIIASRIFWSGIYPDRPNVLIASNPKVIRLNLCHESTTGYTILKYCHLYEHTWSDKLEVSDDILSHLPRMDCQQLKDSISTHVTSHINTSLESRLEIIQSTDMTECVRS